MVGHARVVVRVAPLTGHRLGCNAETCGDGLRDADVAPAVVADGAGGGQVGALREEVSVPHGRGDVSVAVGGGSLEDGTRPDF